MVSGDPLAALRQASDELSLSDGDGADAVGEIETLAPVTGAMALTGNSQQPIDVVFPVLHGPFGEDGSIQGLFEVAGVPYVGSGVLGSAVAMDKAMTKQVLEQAGIPQLPWHLVNRGDIQDHAELVADRIAETIGFPCFIKPANLGSSVGISRVAERGDLVSALNEAAYYDRRVVVEKGVDAREIEMSVLGNDDPIASVAGEVVPLGGFYDYNAKYIDNTTDLVIPAKLDPSILGFPGVAIDGSGARPTDGESISSSSATDYLPERSQHAARSPVSMYLMPASGGAPLPG